MELSIKKTTHEDHDDVIHLLTTYYDFYEREKPNSLMMNDIVTLLVDDITRGLQFIARLDDEAAGFATLSLTMSILKGENILTLNEIFVHPDYLGHRVGKELFIKCQDYTKEKGIGDLIWLPNAGVWPDQVLYDQLGGQDKEFSFYSQ